MTDKINLAELRRDVRLAQDARYPYDIPHAKLLALVDAVEAAQRLARQPLEESNDYGLFCAACGGALPPAIGPHGHAADCSKEALREALARFDHGGDP